MMKKKLGLLAGALAGIILLQAALFGIKRLIFLFVLRTTFSDRMASLTGMLLLTVLVLLICRALHWKTAVFPARFGTGWWCATGVTLALYAATLLIFGECDAEAALLLLYGSVVTPVYEEIIFRGVLWEKLSGAFRSRAAVYFADAILFAVWHLGYWDSLYFHAGGEALGNLLLWKAITGLCYGLVLGLLRLRTKNCYSTILLHGVLNAMAR